MRINLVMSGGGTRLPAHVGAVQALRELGVEIVRVAGASAGSVVAAFVAAGRTQDQLRSLAVDTDYRHFIDLSPVAILSGHGLCAGNRFERWMDTELEGARFRDLPMELRIVATDILTNRPVIFSPGTTPDTPVAEAVRGSMGIPGYFAHRRWQGRLLVDGALCPEALWSLYDDAPDARSIYVLLASSLGRRPEAPRRSLWVGEYAFRLVRMLLVALEAARVPAHHWNDTTVIQTGALSALDFAMTMAQKLELVEQGYQQVKTHLTAKSSLFGQGVPR